MRLAAFLAAARRRPRRATGFTDIGQDIVPRDKPRGRASHGYLRAARGAASTTSISIAGSTPSGQPLFPVPLSDPERAVAHRTRTCACAPTSRSTRRARRRGEGAHRHARQPRARQLAGRHARRRRTTQRAPTRRDAREARVRRGADAVRHRSPPGARAATGASACSPTAATALDCDSGDAADRIAFISPLARPHLGVALRLQRDRPARTAPDGNRAIDVEPAVDVRTVTFALLQWKDDRPRERRRKRGQDDGRVRRVRLATAGRSDDLPATLPAVGAARDRSRRAGHVPRLPGGRDSTAGSASRSRACASRPRRAYLARPSISRRSSRACSSTSR